MNKRQAGSKGERKVKCPGCGKLAEKRGRWKMPDASYNRLYIHETKAGAFGMRIVTKSCIVREEMSEP
jgi:hypothetical protein